MSESVKCHFEGDCRNCGRQLDVRISASKVGTDSFARIKCANCNTVNAIYK